MTHYAVEVCRYASDNSDDWNSFVRAAKNGHFMFDRSYMDYHRDRFVDCSLIFMKDDKINAVMPANVQSDVIVSHGGLTFGGVISSAKMNIETMMQVFDSLVEWCKVNGLTRLVYKAMPHIYASLPAQEDLYALARWNATLLRRDISFTVDLEQRLPLYKGKRGNVSKARKNNVAIAREHDFGEFWKLLEETLTKRHGVKPVHSLEEISLLASRFGDNICLYTARGADGTLLAGAVLYNSGDVIHTQYMASSDEGRNIGALDFLIVELLNSNLGGKYFDFGISTTDEGRNLNLGLSAQKEGFGGRGIVHDFYEVELPGATRWA